MSSAFDFSFSFLVVLASVIQLFKCKISTKGEFLPFFELLDVGTANFVGYACRIVMIYIALLLPDVQVLSLRQAVLHIPCQGLELLQAVFRIHGLQDSNGRHGDI